MGYHPWGRKELDTTERLSTHTLKLHKQYFLVAWGLDRNYRDLKIQI